MTNPVAFRIMREPCGQLGYVPYEFMSRFDAQARKNHCGQTISRLHERGGLSAQEAMACVQGVHWKDRRWTSQEPAWANLKLIVSAEFPDWDFSDQANTPTPNGE